MAMYIAYYPDQDRLAFTSFWKPDGGGTSRDGWFVCVRRDDDGTFSVWTESASDRNMDCSCWKEARELAEYWVAQRMQQHG